MPLILGDYTNGLVRLNAGTIRLEHGQGLGTAYSRSRIVIAEGAKLLIPRGGNFDARRRVIENNGTIETVGGYFKVGETATCLGTGKLVVTGDGSYNSVGFSNNHQGGIPWELVWNGGNKSSAFEVNGNFYAGYEKENTWSGPVTLNTDMQIYSGKRLPFTITGKISGPGMIKNGEALLRIMNPANDFAGGIKWTVSPIANGEWRALVGGYPNAIAKSNFAAGSWGYGDSYHRLNDPYVGMKHGSLLGIDAGSCNGPNPGWTEEEGHTQIDTNGCGSALFTFPGEVITNTWTFQDQWLVHAGTGGTLVVHGDLVGDRARLLNWSGTLAFDEGEKRAGYTLVNDGSLRIGGNAHFIAGTNIYAGGLYPLTPRVEVTDNAVMSADLSCCRGTYTPGIYLPLNFFNQANEFGDYWNNGAVKGDYARGIVDVTGNGVMTNRLNMECFNMQTAAGSVYMRGKELYNLGSTASGSSSYLAQSGCGYIGIEKGAFITRGQFVLAQFGNAVGELVQLGGTYRSELNQNICMGQGGGDADIYLCGGSFTGHQSLFMGDYATVSAPRIPGNGDVCTFTMDNPGGEALFSGAFYLRGCTNGVNIVNFNDGTLEIGNFYRETSYKGQPMPGTHAYLNFNGGTLRRKSNQALDLAPLLADSDRITVFAGGATSETLYDTTMSFPMSAPTGGGISDIEIPAAAKVPWNYIGSPNLTILSATGSGASAIALFDHDRGVVTNVVVTSPGCGYVAGETTVRWSYSGYTNREVTVATVVANGAAGPFTKKGAGKLTLNAANAFGEKVRVEGGTLVAGVDGAIPANLALEIVDGGLDLGSRAYTTPKLTVGSGSITASTLSVGALAFDTANHTPSTGSALVVNGAVIFTDGASITVDNPEALLSARRSFELITATGGMSGASPVLDAPELVGKWACEVTSGGKALRIFRNTGTMFYFR
ncbi:MAG: hypothetical protein MJ240_04800 [Kiritimatiellae bacterium]|nr:hypothetical protein [Kiritimatiellia bacterium]